MQQYIVLLGRVLFSAIFIMSALAGHFSSKTIAFAGSQGVPMPYLFVPLFGLIALAGGLSILLGYKAKWGAWLIVIFLIPVTFLMHRFWQYQDAFAGKMQMALFMKNLSMLGAAFLITQFGSGPLSLDNRKHKKKR